ncbi:TPA: hypothetical protein ACXP60_004358 [Klebsiella variicola subsp. variicola]|uniref:hypothetical protein n=1 Tax=Klebsiella TaxID=570 RepID=UPI002FF3AEA2
MTTDITELAQREKFEAWFVNDVVGADVNFPAFKDGEYAEGEIYDEQLYFMLQAMWMAWKAANAELVEALEKAQQRIASQREYYEGVIADGGKRIAELESRTVKLPEPEQWDISQILLCKKKVVAAIRDAGIKMEAE